MPQKKHQHRKFEPITLVFTSTVIKGKEKEFEAWAHEITQAVAHFEGHLGSNWIRPSGKNKDYLVILKFVDNRDSQKWLQSGVRQKLLRKVAPLIKQQKPTRVLHVTGLETWFTLPGRATMKPPPRWKMVIVTMIGIYPIGLIYQAYLVPYFRYIPLFLRPFALSLILTPILTYLIMPQLTKLLRGFLYPEK